MAVNPKLVPTTLQERIVDSFLAEGGGRAVAGEEEGVVGEGT